MKLKLLLTVLLGPILMANAQTTIPGGVVSGTWTLAGSPYLVQGAVMVASGSKLTIEPGVKVTFQGSYKFLVLGQLLAIGTATDTIAFTTADTTAGWLGIRFENAASANDTSKVYYCKLTYGKATGIAPNDCGGGLYFNNYSKAIISHSLITKCVANYRGAGIHCLNSSPVISYNTISRNSAQAGGGIFCISSASPITNNNISYNTAVDGGGGIQCESSTSLIANNIISANTSPVTGGILSDRSSVTIRDNTISNNWANSRFPTTVSAGGIGCMDGRPIITHNLIKSNIANHGGGGIHCAYNTHAIISNNTISENQANGTGIGGGGSGGGIGCYNASVSILNNIITFNRNFTTDGAGIYCGVTDSSMLISGNFICNNYADENGGGVAFNGSGSGVTLVNNVISNNTAVNNGGAIYCTGSNTVINSNTVSNNLAQKGGALFCTFSSNPVLTNTILWGDTALTGKQIYLDDDTSDPDFYYCNVQGGTAAFGLNANVFYLGSFLNNINSDPLFVLPAGGSGTVFNGITANWSLQGNSPCINSGDPNAAYPATDMAGKPRVFGSVIDIGAYEFQGSAGITNYDRKNAMLVYPNPFSAAATIQLNFEANTATELNIYNVCGEKVRTIKNSPENKIKIERGDLPAGVYFISLSQNNKTVVTKKLIITD